MHLDGIVFKILLTASTARTALTPPEGFNSDFIDPTIYLNTLAESENSQTPEVTARIPFDFCLYGENTAPLEEVQAGQKHLADLGSTLCVVKAIDRYWFRARLTGRDQGRIMATNYHPEGRDVASHCSDVALAVQHIIDHCTSDHLGRKVVGGVHDAAGNGDISVSIGEYAVDPADD